MIPRPFQLERFFARWEFAARHTLSASDCEPMTIGELLRCAGVPAEALLELRLGYTESQGAPSLRTRIASFYSGLSAEDILVTNAPEEAIFLAMNALLRPGDRVVVQTPCYQALFELAVALECEVHRWDLAETELGWRFDLDALDRLLRPGTRLLVMNTPHNPTGACPNMDELATIDRLAAERGARLFSDEMYRGLERTPATPPAATRFEQAISLWGTSKSFGLPGLRIGWLALRDRALMAQLLALKDYTTICSSAPGEWLAELALAQAEPIMAGHRRRIDENLTRARAFAARRPDRLAWREPAGGSVAFPRLVGGSAAAFAELAANERSVLVVPSTLFDHGDAHIRMGLGRAGFPAALAAAFPE